MSDSPHKQPVAGATLADQAAHAAGALAEAAIHICSLHSVRDTRVLAPRTTDLPGLLAGLAREDVLIAGENAARFWLSDQTLLFAANDPALAARLADPGPDPRPKTEAR